ncbi:pyridoxal phosphate-dependent aminotransferase [Martelella lutilitoris]|uniref:aspartate transaminase n=1 Tax=Martelella lutilitoris TaxID=2583532 RepID=A0A7T7HKT7_9HYPH|nr:pyridoxal phosphate-dependent aminotransferase [Martelella lutilitoris]QQM31015.1 pyridoxal phosphate-dependent aminotransferase [Martelella lutilitoris]
MHYARISNRLGGLGSDKWAVHLKARAMQAAGTPILELTIGEPDVAPDPVLAEVVASALEQGRIGYSNGRGEPELLKALSARYAARTGRAIGPENVVCFPGTQTALFAVMLTLVEDGDAVLVGDPLYATYEGVIRSTGAEMVPVPLKPADGFHMRPDILEQAITENSRVLLLNTPHNPTGAVLTAEELAEIGDVCRRHDLWIIADEVYEELIFEGDFASPLDNADLAGRTIAVSSISKSHAAPGFRSGWAIGPAEFCARLLPVAETMLFGNQPFIADATAAAIERPSGVSAALRASLGRRAALLVEALSAAPGIICAMPEAGMFAFVDVSATGLSGEAFALGLLDAEHLAVMPGSSFGVEADGFIRISLTVPDEDIAEAARRICRFAAGLTVGKKAAQA